MTASKQGIERACEIVYEAITGKCWHRWTNPDTEAPEGLIIAKCSKCSHITGGNSYAQLALAMMGPSLATSLDAWAKHIWPVMTDAQKAMYGYMLCEIIGDDDAQTYLATPLHHLETALRMLGKYDEWDAELSQGRE